MGQAAVHEPSPEVAGELRRRLGLTDAVMIGLGAMIGAGIFAAFGPAAREAGSGVLPALALAAVIAYCNATSSARLAARYPASGGTYVYGRERLGAGWGHLAGWAFVAGKTASCAAMALTVGTYTWPGHAHLVALTAVIALTAVNYAGVRKSALLTRLIVVVVLAVLAAVVAAALTSTAAHPTRLDIGSDATPGGVLRAAGLLFFAFAGYARIATLGEEVRDPARTIPRAIPTALAITLIVYTAVAVATLSVLGPVRLGAALTPLADTVRAAGAAWLSPVVRAGAALAALGSLLALILGVSRTTLAMARDHHLPHLLAAPRRTPRRRRGRRPRRHLRRAGRDRFLVLRRADLLRDRQRQRLDPHRARRPPTPRRTRPRPRRLPDPGLRTTGVLGAHRHRGPRRGRRPLRHPPRPARPPAALTARPRVITRGKVQATPIVWSASGPGGSVRPEGWWRHRRGRSPAATG